MYFTQQNNFISRIRDYLCVTQTVLSKSREHLPGTVTHPYTREGILIHPVIRLAIRHEPLRPVGLSSSFSFCLFCLGPRRFLVGFLRHRNLVSCKNNNVQGKHDSVSTYAVSDAQVSNSLFVLQWNPDFTMCQGTAKSYR